MPSIKVRNFVPYRSFKLSSVWYGISISSSTFRYTTLFPREEEVSFSPCLVRMRRRFPSPHAKKKKKGDIAEVIHSVSAHVERRIPSPSTKKKRERRCCPVSPLKGKKEKERRRRSVSTYVGRRNPSLLLMRKKRKRERRHHPVSPHKKKEKER